MKILEAIADELVKVVPDAVVYVENQPQGFSNPSFYIYEINSTAEDEIASYQMRNHSFCIVWFPEEPTSNIKGGKLSGPNIQIEQMTTKLMNEFRVLQSVKLTPFKKEFDKSDGTLVFTFNLRYRSVFVEDDGVKVELLYQEGGIKQ